MGMTKRTARERKRERAVRSSPPSAIPTLEPDLSEMYILNRHNWTNSKSYSSPRQYITSHVSHVSMPLRLITPPHFQSACSPQSPFFNLFLCRFALNCTIFRVCDVMPMLNFLRLKPIFWKYDIKSVWCSQEKKPRPTADVLLSIRGNWCTLQWRCITSGDALHSACITHCKQYCCTV